MIVHRWWATVAVAASLLVPAACASDGSDGSPAAGANATGTTGPAPIVVEHPDWELPVGELVRVPDPPRGEPAGDITPTDAGFLLYGGSVPPPGSDRVPAQLFDAHTGTWTELPPEPFEDPLYRPAVAPVPGGFLVVGAACANEAPNRSEDSGASFCDPGTIEAARYDVAAGAWRLLDLPEAMGGDTTTMAYSDVRAVDLSTGEAIVYTGERTWRYLAATDRWSEIDPLPTGSSYPMCGTEAGFVSVHTSSTEQESSTGEPGGEADPLARYVAHVLTDDGSWRSIPVDPAPARTPQIVSICTDTGVVVLGGTAGADRNAHALTFDADTETWSASALPPIGLTYVNSAVVHDGAVVLAPGSGQTFHYVSATQEWSATVASVDAEPLSADLDGVFVGKPFATDGPTVGDLSALRYY